MAAGTKDDPWLLKTPPGASSYSTCKDPQASPPALVCQAGSTTLRFHLRAIEDLHAWPCGQDGGFPSPRPMFGISLPPMPEESG